MLFYLLCFFFVIVLSSKVSFVDDNRNENSQSLIFLSFIILLLVFGFRYGFGIDYPSYLGIFERLGNNWSRENLEPGFYYLNYFVKQIGGNGYVVIFLSFLIALIFLHKTIRKHSDFPEISYLVFFSSGLIFFYSSGIRQSIALSICLFAFGFILERRLVYFLVTIFFASTFHLTALLFIPVYFFSRIKYRKLLISIIYIFSLFFILKPTLIIDLASPIINAIYGERFSNIISEAMKVETQNVGLGLKIVYFNFLCLLIILMYDKIAVDNKGIILTNFFILGQVLVNVLGGIPDINRITMYFTIFNLLFIPYFLSTIKNSDMRIALYVFFLATLTLFLIRNLQSDVYGTIPYRSILY